MPRCSKSTVNRCRLRFLPPRRPSGSRRPGRPAEHLWTWQRWHVPRRPRARAVCLPTAAPQAPRLRCCRGYDHDEAEDDPAIDEVVTRVLTSFRECATADDKLELARARPSIPREIDRALLLDASVAMQHYDLDENSRYRLRARFWEKYDEG